jgi:signal transduction histidine kinase
VAPPDMMTPDLVTMRETETTPNCVIGATDSSAAPHAPDLTPDERVAFERLLADLSSGFANISSDEVEMQIERALGQLIDFLGFDRGSFGELTSEGVLNMLCSVTLPGIEPVPRGPVPSFVSWYLDRVRSGEIVAVQSVDDFPQEAIAEADSFRRHGLRSQLTIPILLAGRVVGVIGFAAYRSQRTWPPDLIVRLRIVGEVIAQVLMRKRAEDALGAVRLELARVMRLTTMGQMVASIAHEINQPLTAIITNSGAASRWLKSQTPDLDEVGSALERIANDGRRASAVIEGIRTMFKTTSSGRISLDINEVVDQVFTIVKGELKINQVGVVVELTPELPQVIGDQTQLQQVVLNLIMNAVEAMTAVTGRERLLQVRSSRGSEDEILLTFEDTGTGLDVQNLNRIFDAFFTTKPNGMGMGLSICKSIVQAHGGRLWASPRGDYGSTFQVALPSDASGGKLASKSV